MKTIQLTIPDNIEISDLDAKMIFATSLYEKGKLSLGQAAEISGLTKATFMELLNSYGVSVINHPSADLINDIENARHYCI